MIGPLSLFCVFAILAASRPALPAADAQVQLSDSQALEIGKRIWRNECAGTVDGLTSWNRGEDFASLGIGHFIWYPQGKRGPFEESFPKLMAYLSANGIKVPSWAMAPCPWSTRDAFMADFQGPRLKEVRKLLVDTVPWQARFCALRLEGALPKMLAEAPASERDRIKTNFYRVAAQPLGMYALIDYVNFKGEGVSPTERYNGQGWGLLQVLEAMGDGPPMQEFSKAADRVLTRRVANSPKDRNEAKWLPGWRNRVRTYQS